MRKAAAFPYFAMLSMLAFVPLSAQVAKPPLAQPAASLQAAAGSVATASSQTAGRSRLVAIMLPFAHGTDLSDNASQLLAEAIASKLIEEGAFELYDRDKVLSALSEASTRDGVVSAPDDAKNALALARSVNADYAIAGRVLRSATGSSGSMTLRIRLLAADTGKELFAKDETFPEKEILAKSADLAKKIAVASRQRSDLSIAQIDAFIAAGDWTKAEKFVEWYAEAKPKDTARLAERRRKIDLAVAALRYKEAEQARSLFLFDEARRAAREAVERDPSNDSYRDFAAAVDEEEAKFSASREEDRLDRVETFIVSGKHEVALALLDSIGASGNVSPRAKLLRERCNRALEAKRLRSDASLFLEAARYVDALAAVDRALDVYPDEPDSLRLRVRIVETERRDAAIRERWDLYLKELRGYDYGQLFLSHKLPRAYLRLGAGSERLFVEDRAAAGYAQLERGPLVAGDASYEAPFLAPFTMPFSFVDFDLAWFGGLRLAGGTWRTELSSPATVLVADDVFKGEAYGGAKARLSVLSYFLSAGLEVGTGLLTVRRTERIPFGGAETYTSETAWLLGGALRAELGWMPSDRVSAALALRWSWSLLRDQRALIANPGTRGFSLVIGTRL